MVYNVNYILATILCYVLFHYALNPKNGLVIDELEEDPKNMTEGLLFPIFVYISVIVLAFIDPQIAPMGYALFGFMSLLGRKKKKEAEPEEESATLMAKAPQEVE